MAFKLTITKVLPLYPTRAYIEFSVENLFALNVPIPTLVFRVYRSEQSSLTGPFELLNPTGTTSFFYVDESPRLLSFYNTVYYTVETEFQGKKYRSNTTTMLYNIRRDEFLRRRKMLRDEEIVLRKFSGRRIAILKRRHVGPRCTKCYDPNTGNVTRSHCPVCFGTGFKDPYYEPFVTYGARLPQYKEVEEIQQDHGNEMDYSKYQILDYPTVNGQDLVVDLELNDRYKVDRVEQTEIRRYMVHQELVITKLARTDMEYKWPIDPKLLSIPGSIPL